MDEGDTLIIVNNKNVLSFKSGGRANVKYKETGLNESSYTIGKDCEIIAIEKTD